MKIKLSQWAKQNGLSYRTAWNHFQRGLIKGATANEAGSIFIDEPDGDKVAEILEIVKEIREKILK